ncbi:hypothetical protein A0H81_13093 [Grifola frondosa]|uniref:Uncharacterized protein n=1 Tax=Grifola frondosa TaxID=5627 RepID=A0A1C7LS07_GRIFR|nr:hypothetical protein A0H81_13093 [Grifola frondosa]
MPYLETSVVGRLNYNGAQFLRMVGGFTKSSAMRLISQVPRKHKLISNLQTLTSARKRPNRIRSSLHPLCGGSPGFRVPHIQRDASAESVSDATSLPSRSLT